VRKIDEVIKKEGKRQEIDNGGTTGHNRKTHHQKDLCTYPTVVGELLNTESFF
jgi:hypothetical protein